MRIKILMKKTPLWIWPVLIITVALVVVFFLRLEKHPAQHVVLLVLDTLRQDHMSLYGYERKNTPYLKSIASELVIFRNAKAPAPWTIPSHASIFTGLLPVEHKAQWGRMFLDKDFVTLAEILRERGFFNVGITSNLFVVKSLGFAQGFDFFKLIRGAWHKKSRKMLDMLPQKLDQVLSSKKRLFLFLNFMDAHIPYNYFKYGNDFGLKSAAPVRDAKTKWKISAGKLPFKTKMKRRHYAAYDSAVRYLDDLIHEVMSLLEKKGILDQTLLLITSDHGEGLGYHQEIGHSLSTWEEQLSVPLIVRFPGGRKGGTIIEKKVSLTEITPFIIDKLGIKRAKWLKKSPALKRKRKDLIIAEYRSYFSEVERNINSKMAKKYPELAANTHHKHVIYNKEYKLIVSPKKILLFNIKNDRHEKHNLTSKRSKEFVTCLEAYVKALEAGMFTPFEENVLEEEIKEIRKKMDSEILKSMGYIH